MATTAKPGNKNWVNYGQLKDRLDFQRVLEAYGVEVTYRGDQATGFCPFPEHEDTKSKSFSANLAKGIFQCFGCHAKGNVLDFAVRMEGFDPNDTKAFRKGALAVQERFGGKAQPKRRALEETPATSEEEPTSAREKNGQEPEHAEGSQRVINAPLDFELKVDPDHEYLKARGLTPQTIEYFGIGYCNRGLMKGRIAIPLRDTDGTLIGYAGRLVDDSVIDDDNPKYRLPGKREADGVSHEFWKSEFLFNGFRFTEPLWDLIIVEGFFQTMWVHQCGYPNVVGLMGSSMSEKQALLIRRLTNEQGRVFIFPDGDKAGSKMAEQLLVELGRHRCVRWLNLPGDNDPDAIAEENLRVFLGNVGL